MVNVIKYLSNQVQELIFIATKTIESNPDYIRVFSNFLNQVESEEIYKTNELEAAELIKERDNPILKTNETTHRESCLNYECDCIEKT